MKWCSGFRPAAAAGRPRPVLVESPFGRDGTWLRCGLHMHTTNSDGELAPELLVAHYRRAGYDAIAITDHWVRTVAESDGLLLLPGVELNATVDGTGSDAHVLALGLDADPVEPGREFPGLQETVDWIRANGGIAFLAHSYWSGLRIDEFASCDGLCGLEVWNTLSELEVGRGLASLHWDEALEQGRPLLGLATDDSHHPGFDSGFASVHALVDERTPAGLKEALATGRFYGSTGPAIHDVLVEQDAVTVRCSPAASVTLLSARTFGARVAAGRLGHACRGRVLEESDAGIVAARLERWASLPYGRVEVADAHGRKAWTNPLWLAG
jgi:hypothetical protein